MARADADVQSWVGRELADPPSDIVCERGYILHWLEATENANPLYWDELLAKRTTGGPIAPPSMLSAWMRPLQFVPGRTETRMPLSLHFELKKALDLPEGIVAYNEMTLGVPVRPGDRIMTTQRIREISEPKTHAARHRPLLDHRRDLHEPGRRGRRRRDLRDVRLQAGAEAVTTVSRRRRASAARREGHRADGDHGRVVLARLAAAAPRPRLGGEPRRDARHLPQHAEPGADGSSATSPTGRDRLGRLGKLRFRMRRSICTGDALAFERRRSIA